MGKAKSGEEQLKTYCHDQTQREVDKDFICGKCEYCKRLNFRGLKFSRIGPKLKI
ncbi:MAG: hypothetical protein PV344_03525 [Anaplasma sp.]|nr:hypothetical protein [Anaplasma sp.]